MVISYFRVIIFPSYGHVSSRFVRISTLHIKGVKDIKEVNIHRKWELLHLEYTQSFYPKPLLQLFDGMIPLMRLWPGNRILISEKSNL